MGITKTEHFTDEQNELATLAKAIGHPARIAIIEHLIKSKQLCLWRYCKRTASGTTYRFPTPERTKKCWAYKREF